MIKAKASAGTKDLYILGLEGRNLELLREGKPIRLNLKDMDGPDINVVICYGDTQDDIKRDLEAAFGELPEVQ